MRKLKRSVIRHRAEKAKGYKTIKLFRYLWKESRAKKGYITINNGKQVKKKSLLRRTVEKVFGKGR